MADQQIKFVLAGDASGIESAGKRGTQALNSVAAGAKAAADQTRDIARVMPQLTDVFVGLGSGQSPFTVLLQQGGQLKDMFGGIGPAINVVGAAVRSMINPVTLAGAAIGGLAAIYLKSRDESNAYARALILSGEASGATVGKLKSYASAVGDVTGSYQMAREAIAQFAQSGAVPVASLERVGAAAVRLERVGGQAIAETVRQYQELARDPLGASIKLNESTNFLTDSLYRQIKALVDQGKTAEAAALAQQALTSSQENMAKKLEERLGLLEQAWKKLGDTASSVWKSMLNVGTQLELADQLKQAEKALAASGDGSRSQDGRGQERRAALQANVDSLREQIQLENRAALHRAEYAAHTKAVIEWDKTRDQYLSKAEQRERAIAKIREEGRRAGAEQAQIDKLVAEARERYKDPAAPKAPRERRDTSQHYIGKAYEDSMRDFARIADDASGAADELTAAQKRIRQELTSEAWGKYTEGTRQTILAQFFSAQAAEREAAARKAATRAAEEQTRAHKALVDGLNKAADSAEEQVVKEQDAAAAVYLSAQANITLAEAVERLHIARLREKQLANTGDQEAMAAIEREIQAREALQPLLAGKGLREKIDQEREDRVQAEKRAAEQIGQSLSDAIMSGGQSAGKLLQNYFKTLIFRPIIEAAVNPLAQASSSAFSSLIGQGISWLKGGTPLDQITAADALANPNFYQANGGWHAGGWHIVGERGPELRFDGPSRIFSSEQSKQMLSASGGGGVTYAPNNVINIDARSDANQVAQSVGQALQEQQRGFIEQLRAMGVIK